MEQGDSARDFDQSESMKNVGILDVFPIFHTARLGHKICRSPQLPLCGVALRQHCSESLWITHSTPGRRTIYGGLRINLMYYLFEKRCFPRPAFQIRIENSFRPPEWSPESCLVPDSFLHRSVPDFPARWK